MGKDNRRGKLEPALASTQNPKTVPPLLPIHINQLTTAWNLDQRIPTPESRRAWAVARGLDPTNVHRWWCRRRRIAKRKGMEIPEEMYEMDVGDILEEVVEVKLEEGLEVDLTKEKMVNSDEVDGLGGPSRVSSELDDAYTNVPSSTPSRPLTDGTLTLCGSSPPPSRSSSPLCAESELDEPNGKVRTGLTRDSPAPTSSRCSSPGLQPIVTDIDIDYSSDDWLLNPSTFRFGAPTSIFSSSSVSASSAQCSSPSTIRPCTVAASPCDIIPTWCFSGIRIAYDGSACGICSCQLWFTENSATSVVSEN